MTDELDKLKLSLKSATPQPSDAAKKAALMLAQESFEKNFQGSADEARPMNNRPDEKAGLFKGFSKMVSQLTSKQAYLGTASFAAIILAVGVSQNFDQIYPQNPLKGNVASNNPTPVSKSNEARFEADDAKPLNDAAVSTDAVVSAPVQTAAPVPIAEPLAVDEIVSADKFSAPQTQGLEVASGKARSKAAVRSTAKLSHVRPQPIEPIAIPEANTEAFPEAEANPLKLTADNPVSTFSVDVDTASYSFVRSAINFGKLPVKDAVRTEELINYFSYDYKKPTSGSIPFSTNVSVMQTPWNTGTKLMQVGIKGYTPSLSEQPPHNLVFLIDTSGSMNQANKLPLLKQSFRLLLSTLRPEDKVAIVTYAGSAGMALEPTSASDADKIMASLDNLRAGGSTAGQAGLQQAYAIAEKMSGDEGKARVLLATDGDFNVGLSDPKALTDFIKQKRESGTYLSVLGFGRGNYQDATMQALAQNGNGFAAYIDTLSEARKVLVDQVAGSLTTIANDVKIQVEFNPATVAEYRLIGYETRQLKREDFNNDKVDAGDIGAGHTVTAIYEVTPVGSDARKIDPLRYNEAAKSEPVTVGKNDELAFVKLRYKLPGEDKSKLITTPVQADRADIAETEANFAAAVAGVGQILKGSDFTGTWSLKDAEALASSARSNDPSGYRAECLSLLRL
ncbi:MAG: VWA domain-containing protein, partial [Hyphomicrobiales bacterium]